MKAFADLYAALDETTKTNEKVDALTRYLKAVPPEDAAWAIHFLIGRRPKRLVESRKLARWAISPRPSRCCCRRSKPLPVCRCITGSKSGCCLCAIGTMARGAIRWST